jgi:hypothetical protein
VAGQCRVFVALMVLGVQSAMAIDLNSLWDFDDPAATEQRFRTAMQHASRDDALLLQTQIARTYGLRGDFAAARAMLADVEPHLATASAPVRAHVCIGDASGRVSNRRHAAAGA